MQLAGLAAKQHPSTPPSNTRPQSAAPVCGCQLSADSPRRERGALASLLRSPKWLYRLHLQPPSAVFEKAVYHSLPKAWETLENLPPRSLLPPSGSQLTHSAVSWVSQPATVLHGDPLPTQPRARHPTELSKPKSSLVLLRTTSSGRCLQLSRASCRLGRWLLGGRYTCAHCGGQT